MKSKIKINQLLLILAATFLLFAVFSNISWGKSRAPQLLIFDFYNMSNNPEYDNLSPQFAE